MSYFLQVIPALSERQELRARLEVKVQSVSQALLDTLGTLAPPDLQETRVRPGILAARAALGLRVSRVSSETPGLPDQREAWAELE